MMVYYILTVILVLLSLLRLGTTQCSSTTAVVTSVNNVFTLQSTNYPYSYMNYEDCRWSITASSSANRILFSIASLSIERAYDFLNIYDGTSTSATRLYNSQYTSEPSTVTTTGQNAYVRFTSDYSITYGGFQIDYYEVSLSSFACTGTLTATSSVQHVWYTSNSGCYLILQASSGNVVRLTVTNLVTDSWGYLVFGDTDGSSSQTITQDGTSQYFSTTSTAYIQLPSFFYSFVVTYQEVASGTNNIVTVPSTDYGNNICSYSSLSATTSGQYIVSPNYPSPYPYNINCDLRITSANSSNSVTITIDDYEVNFDDNLYIYDGDSPSFNLLGSSWSSGSIINSTGSSLYLRFYSGYTGVLRGFRLNYTETARTLPSCASSYTQYTASTTVQTITKGSYSNNEEVNWLIVKPSASDNLVLDFTFVNVEEATSCRYDNITLFDGSCTSDPIIATFCGYDPVTFEDATGLYVLVKFKSDGSVTKEGFILQYYIGSYVSPDADSSTGDDADDNFKLYLIIAIVAVFSAAVLIAAIAMCVYYRRVKRRRTAIASGAIAPPKTKVKPKTPQQLLSEVFEKSKKDAEKKQNKPKISRRYSHLDENFGHPSPKPPGPGVKVITRPGLPIHPIPNAPFIPQPGPSRKPGPRGKPGPPPNVGPSFYSVNTGPKVDQSLDPVYPPGFDPSAYNKPLVVPEGTIPPPYQYISPNEARSFGLHA